MTRGAEDERFIHKEDGVAFVRHAAHGPDEGHEHPAHAHDHARGHVLDHAHVHDHREENQRRLLLVIGLGLVVLVLEVVGGIVANSLVLLSDAAHMSTDVASVLLAYAAGRLAMRAANDRKTYGYARAEIVAAFLNAIALWFVSAYFIYEAWQRLRAPPEVDATIVIAVGVLSLGVNVGLAVVLHRGSGHSLNVRSAYVHILSDALGSAAAIVAGVGILIFDARWLDPATSIVIAVLILLWTWRLTRDTLHILLEGAPHAVSAEAVRSTIARVPGVAGVHDLHVWSITTGMENMSAHVVVDDPAVGPAVVRDIRSRLKSEHALDHVTIEVEGRDSDCEGCN